MGDSKSFGTGSSEKAALEASATRSTESFAATNTGRDYHKSSGAYGSHDSHYRTIVADPPWPMPDSGKWTGRGGNWASYNGNITRLPYATLTLDEIADLPVSALAEPDAHLYVWTVNRHLRESYRIVERWGFRPVQLLTWCKAPMGIGMGGAFTQTTEHVIFGRRGSLPSLTRVDSTWWQWKRGEHSAKPEAFMDMVESVSPGPYLEMFSRRARLGWDTWGDEALGGLEAMAV